MVEEIVSFPPEVNGKVGQYCIEHSVSLPGYFKEHKEFTDTTVGNSSEIPVFLDSNHDSQDGVNTSSPTFRLAR
jgi:hypothetical protein